MLLYGDVVSTQQLVGWKALVEMNIISNNVVASLIRMK